MTAGVPQGHLLKAWAPWGEALLEDDRNIKRQGLMEGFWVHPWRRQETPTLLSPSLSLPSFTLEMMSCLGLKTMGPTNQEPIRKPLKPRTQTNLSSVNWLSQVFVIITTKSWPTLATNCGRVGLTSFIGNILEEWTKGEKACKHEREGTSQHEPTGHL